MSHLSTTTTEPAVDPTRDPMPAPGARSPRSLRRAGFFGFAASAAFIVTGVLTSAVGGIEPPDDVADMSRYLDEVRDARFGFMLYAIAGIALCVLYIPMSRAVTDLLQGRRAARIGTRSVIAGLVVLVPAYVLAAVGSVGLVNRADGGAGADALFDAYDFSSTAGEFCFGLGSFLSLGLGPFLWGLAAREGRELSRWVWVLALTVGVLGLVWVFPTSEQPVQVLAVTVNVLGSLVLFVAISRRLIRHG